jgi:predicted nuclease of predicted toxin-antitoxin system
VSLSLYMDVHVPRAITEGLRLRGVDVLTAQEDGAGEATDSDLLNRATAVGRLLFSMDADLLREAARRQGLGQPFSGVVFSRQFGANVGACVRDLELLCKAVQPGEMLNRVEFLPLK